MRIYIMVSDDIILKPRVLYRLLQRRGTDVCGVAEIRRKSPRKTRRPDSMTQRRLMGIKGRLILGLCDYSLRVLQYLPLPSFIKSRLSTRNVCSFFTVPYEYVRDVNDPKFIARLSDLKLDIIVSCQGQIFSEELLQVPRIACVNCHPAKLPKYRGMWPIVAAMCNGDDTIGVTAHTMIKAIDKGAIVCQQEFRTSKTYSFMDNCVLAHELYPDVILEALDVIENKGIGDCPWVPADAPYYDGPSPEELNKLRSTGSRMV